MAKQNFFQRIMDNATDAFWDGPAIRVCCDAKNIKKYTASAVASAGVFSEYEDDDVIHFLFLETDEIIRELNARGIEVEAA
jgi:hypothetical protein